MNPTIKITSDVQKKEGTSRKTGEPYVMYYQSASLETAEMRLPIDLDIESPEKAYTVGKVYTWDVVKDLRPGKYGIELARRWTLTLHSPAKAA